MLEGAGEAAIVDVVPDGTFTFLISEVSDSTEMRPRHPARMRAASRLHAAIIDRCVKAHNGQLVEGGRDGDTFVSVFNRASQAVACAVDAQREVARTTWPVGSAVGVRIAVHTGEAALHEGNYSGPALYRCARMVVIANGGQTLVSGATHDLVVDGLPESVSLVDLGMHRLKDLSRPEHVFQLVYPELDVDFPPLRSPNSPTTNLPSDRTSFVGRDNELAELKGLLALHRMVTIAGPGGMGKTRIAIQLASDVIASFPDGTWLVELDALSDPGLETQEIANRLGVREAPGTPLIETLATHLQSRKPLLVLDNCEHLIEQSATIAGGLLSTCPDLTILATSREPLGIVGEHVWRLDPLSLARGSSSDAPKSGAVSNSARLFIERAWPGHSISEIDNKRIAVIEEICRQVDGIPLAIELAAARARMMTVDELLLRLGDRLRVLSGGPRGVPRHQTLRATIDWSYQLLDQVERRLFQRLSVFAGGFTIVAVEEICTGDELEREDVLEVLPRLLDKSLVMPMQVGADERPMRMLASLQQYALERLIAGGESYLYARRHAEYFLRLAERVKSLEDSTAPSDWMDQLEREHENLRAALGSSQRISSELNLRLAAALIGFWDARGYLTEGQDWLAKALATWPEETALRADALAAAGWLAQRQGDFAGSEAYFIDSVRMAAADRSLQARSLRNLALVKLLQGESAAAQPLVVEALSISEQLTDRGGTAGALLVMALVTYFQGDRDGARKYAEQSLAQHRELGDEKVAAFVLACLATVALDEHELARARIYLIESLEISQRFHERVDVAFVLETCARLAAAMSEPARAISLAGAAARMRELAGAFSAPLWSAMVGSSLEPARGELGIDAAAIAWKNGNGLTLDGAIEAALTWLETSRRAPEAGQWSPPRVAQTATGLTRREMEIAALVGHGLRNRDIAKKLYLSARTVDAHIEHIRNKLDFHSRSQIAAWAVARGLVHD